MHRTLLQLFLAIIIGGSSFAAEAPGLMPPQPLTEEAAVTFGRSHNSVLEAARKDVAAASERVSESFSDFLFKVDSGYSYTHRANTPTMAIGPTRMPAGYKDVNRWEVTLQQPLFTGFALISQYRISKLDLEIARYKLEESELNLVRDIRHGFWAVILGERLLQVARDNVASLQVYRGNASATYQQGLTAQNDVLKAEVALSQSVQKERDLARQLVMLRSKFNQLLDLDLKASLTLSESEIKPGEPLELDELLASAEKQRPEYVSTASAVRQADQAITLAKSRYYPQFSAFGQYFREGEDFLAERNKYVNNDNGAVGVRMDWNLFEGGKTRATVREMIYRRQAMEERRKDLLGQIRLQVEDAWEQVRQAIANIETTESAVRQAEENERMTSLQYAEQLVIFLEVLNARVSTAQSRADYYQSLYGFRLAQADLDRATGMPVGGSTKK